MTFCAHEPFDTPGRPKCPGEPDGIHLYKLKTSPYCIYCGLYFYYMGLDDVPDDDELCGDSDE